LLHYPQKVMVGTHLTMSILHNSVSVPYFGVSHI